ncbi:MULTISPECIES: type 1 glutamine amidotransferase [Streptomyces]|uniref:Type 1 glutamine amidotransferase n=1 Tax=Streptomyces solicathayae TaxID=3081768 RepID=A0ABZ0LQ59_9ACTN|nr:type 1 glutamine amidotransferase [Streptomyces sp. HUAS YS2]WOX21455.1 type 1 glutamine amidotransferase [Streptomyces sp. HUAS YS2]
MSAPVVLVVEHEDGTGPAMVGERLTEAGLRLDLRRPWRGDPLPTGLDEHDALLVLGGSMGPYEDERAPWLPRVRELLRQAVARDLPTLGICLGMELLTAACGGKVGHAAHPEVGLVELTLLQEASADPLFANLSDRLHAVQWHWEETETLPEGAVPLVTSDRCTHQAYRLGGRVWGVQFHPEVLAPDIAQWGRADDTPVRELGLDPDEVLRTVEAAEPTLRADWGRLTERWARVVTSPTPQGP